MKHPAVSRRRAPWRVRACLLVIGALVGVMQGHKVSMAQAGGPSSAADATGYTITPLPDGRELLIGGIVGREAIATASIRDPQTGGLTPGLTLRYARAWHTATVLPDGQILVLGGVDTAGRTVQGAERLDLTTGTSEVLPALNWPARFGHSATLLDASEVVLAGGVRDGEPVGEVELLDLGQWQVVSVGTLSTPRAYHTATLLGDGRVAIWGGRGSDPQVERSGATIDTTGPTFTETVAPEPDNDLVWIAASDPSDGAVDVGLQPSMMLRFSRLARIDTLTTSTLALASTSRTVPAEIVPAEGGRLVFVTPQAPLEPDTAYVLTINGVRDTTNQEFPFLTLSFVTGSDTSQAASRTDDDELWDPVGTGRWREWRTDRPESAWQHLPPLVAAPGVTALSGQVLRLNGAPLSGVTLRLAGRSVVTDATGRFLLEHETLSTGWHTLLMDGRTANGPVATYGTFEVAVRIAAGRTTVLPFTSWMPKIDVANTVRIPSPTTTETVITTPLIPGLELRLAPGTVITDEDGRIVREVSITPIPVDRPPFPLPVGVDVPIYFTIQPGGAYVAVTGTTRRGARLIYPNYRNQPAGTSMEFWHYKPDEGRGWYVYGSGAVSSDARQIVPDPGVTIYEFTGAMVAPPSLAPGTGDAPGAAGEDGDPVRLGTGLFVLNNTDLVIQDVLSLWLERTYRPNDSRSRSFGIGATQWYDIFLVGTTFPYTYVDLILPDGARVHYDRISPGTSWTDAVYEHTSSPTLFFKSRVSWNGNGWTLDLKDGTRITFPDGFAASRPAQAAAKRIEDRYGNAIVLTRNADADLTRIIAPNGRWIDLTYDSSHRVTQARDNINRTVQYTYDASGRLWKVTDVLGGVTEYTYDTAHRLLTITDPRGIVYLTNEYDTNGRVIRQIQADTSTFQFAYTLDGGGAITQVDVTDPRGHVRRVTYNTAGYVTSDTYAVGQPEQQAYTYSWQSGTNLLLGMTDPLTRQTTNTYDAAGNRTSVTRLAGTGNAVTETYTYEATFNQLTSVTDALTRQTTFEYDALGSLIKIRDPLNHETQLTYNAAGQVTSITDPLGQRTEFGYENSDLVRYTDPLGRTTTGFVDTLGRLVSITNPLGHVTRYDYNARSQVTRVIDPLGGQTTFTYDPNGSLLTLTDTRGSTTTYTYNNMDRVTTRTDPLLRSDAFVYDATGNLQQITDRKNQVTSYTYDPLDRLRTVTYAEGSTTTHTYDAGDRLTQVADSLAGTITRTYDLLDRLTSETTPEGTVSYTYDAVDRRLTMTVAGQPVVSYGYDNADRLTSIAQGGSAVAFTYDNADRRTALTLPNGITVTYGYDAASQLTSLTYTLATQTLGTLTYSYDLAGRRTSFGGTWARTGLPAALASATYDAANQIANWGGVSLTYDANGNLTNDGTRSYTWNARNELTALSGGVSASFAYDGLRRRRAKTVSGGTTGFLYDGLNTVQELVGGVPSANLLSSLDLDEIFTRTDGSGTAQFLSDTLGSTVALTDAAGAVQTQYTYQPFGATTTTGAANANPFQFTGRENDGTGLLFYRARYQHPTLQRFVSEDPLDVAGGDVNLHAYAQNSPLRWTDPLGLQYVDVNVTPPIFGPVVLTVGVMVSNAGLNVYAGGGIGTPSVSVTVSGDSVSQGWNYQVQAAVWNVGAAVGRGGGSNFGEAGIIIPRAGNPAASATAYFVLPTIPWAGPPGWPGPWPASWSGRK